MNPLEDLTEISNHFEISYNKFTDKNVAYWSVKLISTQPNITGRGETLMEAIRDLSIQQEMEAFKARLQHASMGNKTVQEWKDKIREIL